MRFGTKRLLLVALATTMVLATYVSARGIFYSERRKTEAVLAQVKGISNIELHAHIDVTEEVNSSRFSVDGQPDSIVSVAGLVNYHEGRNFAVYRIGRWRFSWFVKKDDGTSDAGTGEPIEYHSLGSGITLGPGSPLNDLIPFEVNTLQDVVDHYADLVDLFDSWPREDNPVTITLEDGTTKYFYVRDESE